MESSILQNTLALHSYAGDREVGGAMPSRTGLPATGERPASRAMRE